MDAKINYPDLNTLFAKQCDINLSKSENFTKHFFNIIIEGLQKDGIVKINGLGTFKMVDVAGRSSVNVNTGEKIEIKEHRKLTFIPSDTLKEKVNQPFSMFEPFEVSDDYVDEEENPELQSEHQHALQSEQSESSEQSEPSESSEQSEPFEPSEPSEHDIKSIETNEPKEQLLSNEHSVAESLHNPTISATKENGSTIRYIIYTLLLLTVVAAGAYFSLFFTSDTLKSPQEIKSHNVSYQEQQPLPTVAQNIPTDTLPPSATEQQTKLSSVKEDEPFVLLDELLATRLATITIGDTLLYSANGNSAIHRVGADETLTRISLKYYGDKRLWPYIVNHNKLGNHNQLEIGMELAIPRLIPREKY